MNKKYELVQDIKQPNDHNYKAGEIFTKKNKDENSAYLSSDERRAFHPCIVENNPTWFKEIVSEPKIEVDLFQGLVDSKTNYSSDKGYYNKYYLHIYNCKLSNEQHSLIKEAIEKILNPNTSTPTSELVEDKKDADWEILSYLADYVKGQFVEYKKHSNGSFGFIPENILKSCGKIHSVLRKSDNTVWTIGDEVYYDVYENKTHFKIDSFKVEKNIVYLYENTCPMTVIEKVLRLPTTANDKEVKKEPFVWTDELAFEFANHWIRDRKTKYEALDEFKSIH